MGALGDLIGGLLGGIIGSKIEDAIKNSGSKSEKNITNTKK
ncbi:hypothetical protein [Brachyspira aalborgi]|nr:hypothetical protein [Brachyspira aalborgi]